MLKDIKVNMNVIESMLYFWTATSEKDKVGEKYLTDLSRYPEMKLLYDSDFDEESVRKVLSAISNREKLNGANQKERQFWNNNMWMLEDLDYMKAMVAPLKVLNLDSLVDEINQEKDIQTPVIDVIFVPANKEEYLIKDNKLIINFFKLTADLINLEEVTINGQSIREYIKNAILMHF